MKDPRIQEIRTLLPQAMLADWLRLGSRLVRTLRDHHHPAAHDAILERLVAAARKSVELRNLRKVSAPSVSYPAELPITARKNEIVELIRANRVVIVAGETGSGKTTQLPKMLLEAGCGIEAKIGCTQPRRLAAFSVSRRIAEELNVTWGAEVGCKVRFDDRTAPETFIKLVTDGMLLAELRSDPLLSEYNAIIIDEAHERSLNIDFLLGYLKSLLSRRPDLRLVITSATINTEAFSKGFNNAPVINVSGRVYPVDVVYSPIDAASEEAGERTYIDAAALATETALGEAGGDILVFMPTERDVRETVDQLKTRFGAVAEIIPLYGRLGSAEQQRVFALASRRKVVIATNIAETSLTIPGIQFVIDSGLARIRRYNPRTRTNRLPIEPISQSSANQRKGRSGRVREGICVRLYSEQDFAARPLYTQPEIQRANLAEVILRMKAFQLGEIETFPFLDPPSPAAISSGYALLQELGALDDSLRLRPIGEELAHLPIDPTLGRMLLQSRHEHATRELLIIAAGLSIQDPRERPAEQKDAATAAHRKFEDPHSDFLTLLNIWNAVHEQYESLSTQNQRRKFCRANFLSYVRMREWQDLHAELCESLEELGGVPLNDSSAAFEASHRSIVAGLLGHCARRKERNLYEGAGNRLLRVFPGSALYDRGAVKKEALRKPRREKEETLEAATERSNQPEWIVAGEIVETSQVFARTVAGIDPEWIADLGAHLCKRSWHNPRWDADAGQVLADEKLTFKGLEVRNRRGAFGPVDPKQATEIFIRSALVEENLMPEEEPERLTSTRSRKTPAHRGQPGPADTILKKRFPFLLHNRKLREKIETWQTRMRRHDLPDLDEALFKFYAARLPEVSSRQELQRLLASAEPGFLCATETDLSGKRDLRVDTDAFPDSVALGGAEVPLSYSYSPGEESDGVTLQLPLAVAESVSPASVQWAVPGLREAQVQELLRALPKSIRRELMPLAPKAAELARELQPGSGSLRDDLAKAIFHRYGVRVPSSAWLAEALPQHLVPRLEVVGHGQKTLGTGRDLEALRRQLREVKTEAAEDAPEWARVAAQWERFGVTRWNFPDIPERLLVKETGAGPVYAWPGLELADGEVNIRLFRTQDSARASSGCGFRRLAEIALQKELAWLQKDLRGLARLEPLFAGLASVAEVEAMAFEHLKEFLLPIQAPSALTSEVFQTAVDAARARLPGLANRFIEQLDNLLKLRRELLRRTQPAAPRADRQRTLRSLPELSAALSAPPGKKKPSPTPGPASLIGAELERLLPKGFLEITPFERLPDLARYLKALLIRADRAQLNPVKDRERAARLIPYEAALSKLRSTPPRSDEAPRLIDEFRWLLEEYRVSLFAQELGTAVPVSPKRLDEFLGRLGGR